MWPRQLAQIQLGLGALRLHLPQPPLGIAQPGQRLGALVLTRLPADQQQGDARPRSTAPEINSPVHNT